jgi:hypothetical protein
MSLALGQPTDTFRAQQSRHDNRVPERSREPLEPLDEQVRMRVATQQLSARAAAVPGGLPGIGSVWETSNTNVV